MPLAPPAADVAPNCTGLHAPDRALCAAQAAWLRAVLRLAPLAWLLYMTCVLVWLAHLLHGKHLPWLPWVVLLLAVCERGHALRLALDAQLFEQLAAGHMASLADVDAALHRLGLRAQPPNGAVRPLAERVRGCQRLVWRYAACVLCLVVITGVALCQAA